MSTTTSETSARVSGLRIGYALFAGILAWMVHLIGQSGLTGWVCRTGQLWPMHAITVLTLLAVLHALWVGWRIARAADPDPGVVAARFLGYAAVGINVFNAVLIVAEWVPVLVVHPCAGG